MDDAYSSVCRFCLLVHSKTPEEVSSCEKESIELENSEDVSNKIGAKVNRRGVSSQKVVLIDPILKEEDAYHDDSMLIVSYYAYLTRPIMPMMMT